MIIQVKVYPSSRRKEIIRISENNYKIYLKKPAEDNKANLELIKMLSKHFKCNAKIIKGFQSREKIIKIGDK